MEIGKSRELPARVEEICRRIKKWRTTRVKTGRMPEELWEAAVELAQAHGIYAIKSALGVSYDSLKNRVIASRSTWGTPGASKGKAAAFVELSPMALPIQLAESCGPRIEMVDRRGEKLGIHLARGSEVDVLGLAKAFWDRRS